MTDSAHNNCLEHSRLDSRVESAHERINAHGEQIDTLQDCVGRLIDIAERLPDHEERLRALELRGSRRWDSITLAAVTGIVTGVLGMMLGKVI